MSETEPISVMPEVRIVKEQELYDIYASKDLAPKPGQKVRVLVNMIQSLDGVTTIMGPDGKASEQGIGHPVDQNLMRHLRFHADATLNGSATLRVSGSDSTIDADKYPDLVSKRKELGKSENPIACVSTSRANPEEFDDKVLEKDFFHDKRFHSILFVGEDAPEENLERIRKVIPEGKKFDIVKVSNAENGRPDVKVLVDTLHDKYGVKTLLSEGGARLNGSLFDAGLITDFFITISPKPAGASPKTNGIMEVENSHTKDNLEEFELVSSFFEPTSRLQYFHYTR